MKRFPLRTVILMALALVSFVWFWWQTHRPRPAPAPVESSAPSERRVKLPDVHLVPGEAPAPPPGGDT